MPMIPIQIERKDGLVKVEYALNGGTDAKPTETAIALWEKGKLMCKVEFIESYIKVGNDYQWNDNHGELIRCKNCRSYESENNYCNYTGIDICEDGFCSYGERKVDG